MQPKNNLNARVAESLAKPFTLKKGRGSAPLSFRLLPDGGMVVITCDGRKLWFSADEVAGAVKRLSGQSTEHKLHAIPQRQAPPLSPLAQEKPHSNDERRPVLIVQPRQETKPVKTVKNHEPTE